MSGLPITRRTFLGWSGAGLLAPAIVAGCRRAVPAWNDTRLVHGAGAGPIERAAIADAAALLAAALDRPVPIVAERGDWARGDIFVARPGASDALNPDWRSASTAPGSFRLLAPADGPAVVVAGADAEGARNGLYRLLEFAGFGFVRDGERIPRLVGGAMPAGGLDLEMTPAFRWRGEMIWDNYLGPSRYCAAAWGPAEWERALVHMARTGLNFLEFYPPMEAVWRRAFPDAEDLADGPVWMAAEKHAVARAVLQRGRALGIQFMYVLTYGWFPAGVRRLHPNLEWTGGGYLCAHQPELKTLTDRVWAALVDEFGTDHLIAIRHRGEEGQSYSDPCRSVTKAQGTAQAFDVLRALDPDVVATVWTWAEEPALFDALPVEIRAAHIRHGLGGMFADVGSGREQTDGRPLLAGDRHWLSGQFTVFSGCETLVQTAWSDPVALAADARASADDPTCDGYFQWPEWTATSPWLSDTIARLSWDPYRFDVESALSNYAAVRHGSHARLFLLAFRPLVEGGNGRVMITPRKRCVVPYFLSVGELGLLRAVRDGVRALWRDWPADASPLLQRDLVDLLSWVGVRQAHVFEAAAHAAYQRSDRVATQTFASAALETWDALRTVLATVPELSVVESARRMAAEAPTSARAVDSFWTLACDFYRGYPLMLSPEAIELVFAEQSRRFGRALDVALASGVPAELPEPGFFWHDFPEPRWAATVVGMPAEDAVAFEREMRARIAAALDTGAAIREDRSHVMTLANREPWQPLAPPTVPSAIPLEVLAAAVARLLDPRLPAATE